MFNKSKLLPLNNVGLYFYLVGTLVFLFADMKTNDIPNVHAFVILLGIIISSFVVFNLTVARTIR